jgi:uncharacterized protein YtpQ (UPF0354 family)
MIIDDTISFFGIYHHNCIINLGLPKQFSDLYSSDKYRSVILCQKDPKNGYLLTQSILSKENMTKPYMRSHYFVDKQHLVEGYKNIIDKIDSSDNIFYLLMTNDNFDYEDSERLVTQWKKEVKDAIKETEN